MTVDKIENISYKWHEDWPVIKITFKEEWTPVLIDTEHADRVVLWWDCDSRNYRNQMKLFAIEDISTGDPLTNRVKTWKEVDIQSALLYIKNNII